MFNQNKYRLLHFFSPFPYKNKIETLDTFSDTFFVESEIAIESKQRADFQEINYFTIITISETIYKLTNCINWPERQHKMFHVTR